MKRDAAALRWVEGLKAELQPILDDGKQRAGFHCECYECTWPHSPPPRPWRRFGLFSPGLGRY